MCFSAEVSLGSFIIGIVFSIILFFQTKFQDYRIVSIFLGFVSLMQLIEYFLWKHQKCDNINKNLSYLGMILNHSQPIVLGALVICLG